MSAKKVTDLTKFTVEESTDSGFLSGPINEQLLSEELEVIPESDVSSEAQVSSEAKEVKEISEDQGVCLTGDLIDINSPTETEPAPAAAAPVLPVISVNENRDFLLALLFRQDEDGDT